MHYRLFGLDMRLYLDSKYVYIKVGNSRQKQIKLIRPF